MPVHHVSQHHITFNNKPQETTWNLSVTYIQQRLISIQVYIYVANKA